MTDIVDNKHNCAALSFHKSLIGLMQLNQLEEVSSVLQPSFLSSRVLNTYYTVYHLHCSYRQYFFAAHRYYSF